MIRVTAAALFFCACATSTPHGEKGPAVARVAADEPRSNPPAETGPGLGEGRGDGAPPDDLHPWAVHDLTRPQPAVVEPPTPSLQARPGRPPSDAVVLFDSHAQHPNLDAFVGHEGIDAPWTVVGNTFHVAPGTKSIRTRQSFSDIQLHVEWKVDIGEAHEWGQKRGNSGLYIMGRYEVQIGDHLGNLTYADGMAGSVYAQNPPLVNAGLGLDRWQTYDIVFRAPRWAADGTLEAPADVTVLHNGLLVQDHWILEGPTTHKRRTSYEHPHGPAPLVIQDHSDIVHYRNLWLRELPPRPVSRQVLQRHQ